MPMTAHIQKELKLIKSEKERFNPFMVNNPFMKYIGVNCSYIVDSEYNSVSWQQPDGTVIQLVNESECEVVMKMTSHILALVSLDCKEHGYRCETLRITADELDAIREIAREASNILADNMILIGKTTEEAEKKPILSGEYTLYSHGDITAKWRYDEKTALDYHAFRGKIMENMTEFYWVRGLCEKCPLYLQSVIRDEIKGE